MSPVLRPAALLVLQAVPMNNTRKDVQGAGMAEGMMEFMFISWRPVAGSARFFLFGWAPCWE